MNSQPMNRRARACAFAASLLVCAAIQAQQMPTLAPMIERVSPSVVNISVSGRIDVPSPLADDPFFGRFFNDRPREIQSAGSGVIVDAERGLLLTNHHVVANASEITVTLLDNRTAEAEVIGSDQASDLAVLRIDTPNLTEMEFGDSENISVGDYVVAIGNPFGFSNTVTSGIVSGLDRSGINPDRNAYEDFIQTDASINPGNSGGALVDLNGRLIGVNSAIVSRGGGNVGIGFAIPVNMARSVMEQLVEFGVVRRGLLGVTISSVEAEEAETLGLPTTAGAVVDQVSPDSAAENAGILAGDVIVSVDGENVANSADLRNTIGLLRPGDSVEIGIVRDGREQVLGAVLGAQITEPAVVAALPTEPPAPENALDGVELQPGETERGESGLLVVGVAADSPAARGGLREGDVITRINRQRVSSPADARQIAEDGGTLVVRVMRGSRDSILWIR